MTRPRPVPQPPDTPDTHFAPCLVGNAIECPFPLRPDFTARFLLPCDLTIAEVRRITAMLETLTVEADS